MWRWLEPGEKEIGEMWLPAHDHSLSMVIGNMIGVSPILVAL